MSSFKPKRVSGADLAAQLSDATRHTPAAVVTHIRPEPPPAPVAVEAANTQVNFKVTTAFADLIAEEAAKAGSTRRFFARLMRDAGYPVPEADVNPPEGRRRGRRGDSR